MMTLEHMVGKHPPPPYPIDGDYYDGIKFCTEH